MINTKRPTKKLGRIANIVSGTWGVADSAGTAVLRSTNFNNDGTISWKDVAYRSIPRNKIEQIALKQNDILIEKSGGSPNQPVGRVVFFDKQNDKEIVYGNFISKLRVIDDNLLPKFVFYYLLYFYKTDEINKLQSQTTGIRNLQIKEYLNIEIPQINIETQQKIVERLDEIRKTQELCNTQIQKNEELFESVAFSELNTLGLTFGYRKIEDLCEVARGGSPRPINKYLTNEPNGVNWIKIGDVQEGDKYITKTSEKITLDGISKTRTVKPGDFILSNSMSFGRPYISKISGAIHDGWLLIRIKKDLLSDFLYYILGSVYVREQFERGANGWVVRNLNSEVVRRVEIPVPDLKTQQKIAEKLDAVQDYKRLLLKQKELLKELFESVLYKSMKGEID